MTTAAADAHRVVVLDFAHERTPITQFLDCIPKTAVYWIDPREPDLVRQSLVKASHLELALLSLTDQQARWLLRTLQVNRFQILMEEMRQKAEPTIRDLLGVFVALLTFCRSGGGGLVVANIFADRNLDAFAGEQHLNLGPIRKLFGPIRLAFVSRRGIGAVPFALSQAPAKFGFINDRSEANRTTPPEWWGLEFSFSKEQELRLRREFPDGNVQAEFLGLCEQVFAGKKHAMLHALHALRLCRRMVTWTLEGSPFRCTLFIGGDEAYARKTTGTPNEIATVFTLQKPIPFDFDHLTEVRDLAEMIQSDALFLSINVDDGSMRHVSAHAADTKAGEHYWMEKYGQLTRDNNCLVIHLRGGHFVELYGRGDLRLWFDGYAWQLSPYQLLERVCRDHFREGNDPGPKARRLMQVIPALLDEQKSSILLLLHDDDETNFKQLLRKKSLHPLRPKIAAWNPIAIDRFPVSALEGFLKLDGSHVIDWQGRLRYVAFKIGDKPAKLKAAPGATPAPTTVADNEGTGTRAARNLSQALPSSFVIKVSASGSIKILTNGKKVERE